MLFRSGADPLRRLIGQQALDIGLRAADQLALLVQLELVEANVGDLVGQVAVELELRQRLLLLIEDLGQQQAALEHADLLFQGLIALAEVVQLLLGLHVLLGQCIEAVGGPQQIVGELEVGGALAGQQLIGTGVFRLDRKSVV